MCWVSWLNPAAAGLASLLAACLALVLAPVLEEVSGTGAGRCAGDGAGGGFWPLVWRRCWPLVWPWCWQWCWERSLAPCWALSRPGVCRCLAMGGTGLEGLLGGSERVWLLPPGHRSEAEVPATGGFLLDEAWSADRRVPEGTRRVSARKGKGDQEQLGCWRLASDLLPLVKRRLRSPSRFAPVGLLRGWQAGDTGPAGS